MNKPGEGAMKSQGGRRWGSGSGTRMPGKRMPGKGAGKADAGKADAGEGSRESGCRGREPEKAAGLMGRSHEY